MTTLIQMDATDLRTELKNCLREAINEFKELPLQPELPDKIGFNEAVLHCNNQGIKLSDSKARKMCMDGEMPTIGRFGRRLVFSRKQLDNWIESQTVKIVSPNDVMVNQLAKVARNKR